MSKNDDIAKETKASLIKIQDIQKVLDDRGFFAEILREDWRDLLSDQNFRQVSLSMSYPGTVRAWHRHSRGQYDSAIVLRGSLHVAVYDDDENSATYKQMSEVVVGEERLQAISYPGRLWHGTKTLGVKPSLTIYTNNNLYDYEQPDEERRPWNDQTIINPRTQKPYDWNQVANR